MWPSYLKVWRPLDRKFVLHRVKSQLGYAMNCLWIAPWMVHQIDLNPASGSETFSTGTHFLGFTDGWKKNVFVLLPELFTVSWNITLNSHDAFKPHHIPPLSSASFPGMFKFLFKNSWAWISAFHTKMCTIEQQEHEEHNDTEELLEQNFSFQTQI